MTVALHEHTCMPVSLHDTVLIIDHSCCTSVTYKRCPSFVPGYNYYCYIVVRQIYIYESVGQYCAAYNGWPVWLDDADEFEWLMPVLESIDVNCFHMGE